MQRIAVALLLVTILLSAGSPARAQGVQPGAAPPSLWAGAYILMDWSTGEILHQKNAHQRRAPASTTKVLTAVLALERGRLDDKVVVSRRAGLTPGSSMYIRAGEAYSLHDLLHGLLLRSGNDAAVAIAEYVSGSVEEFARLMNQRAQELGARNSHFVNPHGLTAPDHYSTAYDLAVITRHALSMPLFAEIVSMQDRELRYEYLHRDVVLHNTNALLGVMPDADGVKTGTTAAAGPCLVASATRDEHKLIAVVLNARNRWSESAQLLEWGYRNWRLAYMGRKGEVVRHARVVKGKFVRVPVALGADVAALLKRTEADLPSLELQFSEEIRAPLARGQAVGKAVVRQGGRIVSEAPLVASADVPKRNLLDAVYQTALPLLRWISDFDLF